MTVTFLSTFSFAGELTPRTTFADMVDALFGAVKLVANETPVAWEGIGYDPALRTTHWHVFTIPRPTSIQTLGIHGWTEHRGILQINVRVPIGDGPMAALRDADRLYSYFRRGLTLDHDVRVIAVDRGSISVDKAWATLPVSIRWRSSQPE